MKKLAALTAMAALTSTTALANDFGPAVNAAIRELADDGYREVRVQRNPLGARLIGSDGDDRRVIVVALGSVVADFDIDDDEDDRVVFARADAVDRWDDDDDDDYDDDDDDDDLDD